MITTLYPVFQKWSKSGSVYCVSDTHFSDPDRDFMGYSITEEEQIDILKKKCHRNDTLICLGDVGDISYISKLNCYKVLIMGNHDTGVENYLEKEEMFDLDNYTEEEVVNLEKSGKVDYVTYGFHKPFIRGYKSNNLFNEVYTGPLWISEKLVLSHEPLLLTSSITKQPIAFNIHGHDHNKLLSSDDYHLNICQNVFGYEPLNLKEFIREGYLKRVKSIHREIIDNATKKKYSNDI